jgi:Chaperone of endosialidase
MAGNVSGLHTFAPDVGPEALSLLDGNFGPLTTALNTLLNFSNYYVDSGAANGIVVTVPAPQVFAYTDGVQLLVKVAATNTLATTLNVNGLGNKNVVDQLGAPLVANTLIGGNQYTFTYNAVAGTFTVSGTNALSKGLFGDGSAAAPSIAFADSLAAGFYLAGTNIIGVATNGLQRATWGLNGDLNLNAPSSSATPLNVTANSSTSIAQTWANTLISAQVLLNSSSGLTFGTTTTHTLSFETNGLSRISIIGNTGVLSIGSGVTAGNPVITFTSGSTAVTSLLNPSADATTYSLLGRSQAGPGIQARWDSGSGNRPFDLGFYDNAGTFTVTTRFGGSVGQNAVQFPNVGTTASAANAFLDNASSPANNLLRFTSSIRYKTDVTDLTDEEARRVLKIRPVTYRSTSEYDDPGKRWIGVIAEELVDLVPELVIYTKDESGADIPDGVDYARLSVLMLSVLKQQSERLNMLEQKNVS